MKTKAILTLTIEYDGPDATDRMIRPILDFMLNHAAGNGMFSQEANLEVDSWYYTIQTEKID